MASLLVLLMAKILSEVEWYCYKLMRCQ